MPTNVTTTTTMRAAIEVRRRKDHFRAAVPRGCRSFAVLVAKLAVGFALINPSMPQAAAAVEAAPPVGITRDPSGEGFIIPGKGLWLAGDATITGSVPEGKRAIGELDDLTLLTRYEPSARFTFFSEVRLEDT